jgi:serine/threonine protein kinase
MLDQIIGKYRLTRFIGEGGMANVYEGTHITLGTKAAIKILNPILAKNEQFRQRFQNEAALMASLDHPNITKVFDFEDDGSNFAIVMELLEGMDLNDWVKEKGAFNFETFKPILVQILQSFQYAHNKGILHRDIKPSNIFMDKNGKVKILDFGIAKLFGTGNEMTQTGTQMGTPAYMSPEQVRADKSIDHRSDIYSLGVTLFFALTGHSPYDTEKESQFDIFNKIVFENLPELIENEFANSIIKKACEKDRTLRFQSALEMEDFILENQSNVKIQNEATNRTLKTESVSSQSGNKNKSINKSTKNGKSKWIVIIFSFTLLAGLGVAIIIANSGGEKKDERKNEADSTATTEEPAMEYSADTSAILPTEEAATADTFVSMPENMDEAPLFDTAEPAMAK